MELYSYPAHFSWTLTARQLHSTQPRCMEHPATTSAPRLSAKSVIDWAHEMASTLASSKIYDRIFAGLSPPRIGSIREAAFAHSQRDDHTFRGPVECSRAAQLRGHAPVH